MRDTRRDEYPTVIMLTDLDGLGDPFGRGTDAKVVQDHPRPATRDVPIVGLVKVVVEPDDSAGLLIRPAPLHHLAPEAEP